MTIYREDTRVGLALCSAAKARQYLQNGCMGYLVYVFDIWIEKGILISDMPLFIEYPNVFLEELPSVPHERQVEFRIDLVFSAAMIAQASYRLTPLEMQDLSSQL